MAAGSASCSYRLLTGQASGVPATVPVAYKEPWHAGRQMTAVMTGARSALVDQLLVLGLRPPRDRLSAWFPLWLRL
jgi:hypothetical protein